MSDIPRPIGLDRSTSPLRAYLPNRRAEPCVECPTDAARLVGGLQRFGVGDMHILEQATNARLWRIATAAGLLATPQAILSRSTNHV